MSPIDPATIRATAQRVVDAQDLLTEQEIIDMHDALTPPTKLDRADDMAVPWRTHAFAFARAAYAKGLAAQSHATALADAEREAARKAWDACSAMTMGYTNLDARDRYLAREYPAPATRECVLSSGSVVRVVCGRLERSFPDKWARVCDMHQWVSLLDSHDTGADFDKLKSFAAGVGR